MRPLASYHLVWLAAHPHRTADWLRERFKDGFDIHHLDGDKGNEASDNLVLIEHSDHMMLHGGRRLGRLGPNKARRPHKARRRATKAFAVYEAAQRAIKASRS